MFLEFTGFYNIDVYDQRSVTLTKNFLKYLRQQYRIAAMPEQIESLSKKHIEFTQQQHICFVTSLAEPGRVNQSSEGTDTLRILDDNRAIWVNLTGSRNQTAAHLLNLNRITLMLCAFRRQPLLLRLFCTAKVIHKGEKGGQQHISKFEHTMGGR